VESPIGGSLSLPETFAVLEGPRADAHEIVFLALVELVARGIAELVPVAQDEVALSLSDRPIGTGPVAALAKMLAGCQRTEASDGRVYVPTGAAARGFSGAWATAARFVRNEVWRALVARDLVTTRPNVLDSLFVIDAWHLTPAGDVEKRRLEGELAAEPRWKEAPAIALLVVQALPVPSDATFDALDELEDLITPGGPPGSDAGTTPW
jgi:hypothetical protein